MDMNEITGEVLNRHPWELSRTRCVRKEFSRYLNRLDKRKDEKKYINVGAGDLYFDESLLSYFEKDEVYAVDIAYQDMTSANHRMHKHHFLEEIPEGEYDYAIMMDSLEYMEDDVEYVKRVSDRIENGGYFFFTLPASPALFSDYDRIVKNLRRYSFKTFHDLIAKVPKLEIVEEYNFYTSLFLIRLLQKWLHLSIDPEHKVTSHWKYAEEGFLTRLFTGCLNLDFVVNRLFRKIGIRLPGLSMLVVCKKTGGKVWNKYSSKY